MKNIAAPFQNLPLTLITLAMLGIALGLTLMYFRRRPDFANRDNRPPWLVAVAYGGVFLLPLLALLFMLTLAQIMYLWFSPRPADPLALNLHYLAIVGFLAVLGGLLATFFAYMRVFMAEHRTRVQESGILNQRIGTALQNLAAGRVLRDAQGNETLHPLGEVRMGAIYSLEGVARDNPGEHCQIMDILTAYIRENAPAASAARFPLPQWEPLAEYASATTHRSQEIWRDIRFGKEVAQSNAWQWGQNLPAPRVDIQAALVAIGRRSKAQIERERADTRTDEKGYRIDLSRTNLQHADLSGLNLERVVLHGAHLEGAILHKTRLARADLSQAHLEGADLAEAQLQNATLSHAHMEGANLKSAHLDGADLTGVRFEGADLGLAGFEEARLKQARFEGADLRKAHFERADLNQALMEGVDLTGAHLEGARLDHARLEAACLRKVSWDASTSLAGTNFRLAAIAEANLTNVKLNPAQINAMFGDGTVVLPAGVARPVHWPVSPLHHADFRREWQKWQHDPAAYVPPQPSFNQAAQPARAGQMPAQAAPAPEPGQPGQIPPRPGQMPPRPSHVPAQPPQGYAPAQAPMPQQPVPQQPVPQQPVQPGAIPPHQGQQLPPQPQPRPQTPAAGTQPVPPRPVRKS